MDRFILSNSNVRVPRIIYGTAWKKSATEKLVSLAIKNGFRGIDTACQPKHYDEAGVGAGVAAGMKKGVTRSDMYLYQSFWTLSANPHLLAHKTVTALAGKHNRTTAQILFRYLVSVGVVPLTGTKSEAHMRDDLAIFGFELTDDELSAIAALC
jgi:diketogulonate reductase-like aldo/keto reductase